nr:ubiquitin thioesterase otubain-like [Setaria viridis]
MAAGRGVIFHSNALNLRRAYSEFRPVHGDGDCFYMSFIFSYLEQVLHRQDTHEEHRLLATVRGVARQQVRLGWTSEFSWRHKAFKILIKKVMRWKRHRRWKHVPTTNSYRTQKLLNFFSGYGRTNDIFTFLRLVAAIWICSHSEEFEPLVPELNEDCTLRDWCCREVIQCKVFTDHVQMTALVTTLGVPLRVEYLLQGAGQDLYTGQEDTQDDTPRNTCWPRRHHQVPRGHVVPCVTVLYTNAHYDIIYPHCRDVPSVDERCSQQIAQVQRLVAASSSQQIARGDSWSGRNSSQRIARGKSSTGVQIQINMMCRRKLTSTSAHEYDECRSIAE